MGAGILPEGAAADQNPGVTEHTEGFRIIDEATFTAFYQETAQPLWSYIYRVSGDAALADDIVQEAFYRLLQANLPKMAEAQMKAYLYKIGTNLLNDHWRSQKREQRWLFGSQDHEGAAEERSLNFDLAPIFQQLKPQERSLLWLAYIEGFAHKEIAGALGLKEKSIRVLLFRARQKLATLLMRKGLNSEET